MHTLPTKCFWTCFDDDNCTTKTRCCLYADYRPILYFRLNLLDYCLIVLPFQILFVFHVIMNVHLYAVYATLITLMPKRPLNIRSRRQSDGQKPTASTGAGRLSSALHYSQSVIKFIFSWSRFWTIQIKRIEIS